MTEGGGGQFWVKFARQNFEWSLRMFLNLILQGVLVVPRVMVGNMAGVDLSVL